MAVLTATITGLDFTKKKEPPARAALICSCEGLEYLLPDAGLLSGKVPEIEVRALRTFPYLLTSTLSIKVEATGKSFQHLCFLTSCATVKVAVIRFLLTSG
jgi:hypothetical protein